MKTISFYAKSFDEFEQRLNKEISDAGFKPTLAFAFVSVEFPIKKVSSAFKKHDILLFGETSSGEILFNENEKEVLNKSAVFILTDIDPAGFSSRLFEREGKNSFDFGKEIGTFIKGAFDKPSVIIGGSGLDLDGQRLVEGIKSVAGTDLVMFGGLAGDDGKFQQTFVFNETTVSDNGTMALIFDSSKIQLSGIATSGWVGLGMNLIITKSEGNVVYTINDKAALDVYLEYLSISIDDMPAIGLEYPLLIKRENNIDALRAVTGIDKEKRSLLFAGSVPQGSTVMFSSSPGFDVIESTKSKVLAFAENNPDADMFLLFSCIARHLALGPMVEEEINLITEKWNAPVAGFFTYGEIGTNPGKVCDFYNQTYTLVSLKDLA